LLGKMRKAEPSDPLQSGVGQLQASSRNVAEQLFPVSNHESLLSSWDATCPKTQSGVDILHNIKSV
jgi:hypothetical protein